jgi:very-short-patch-repair endonuclease
MKTIEVVCSYCGKPVTKPLKEHARSIKRGRVFYCNGSCAAAFFNSSKKIPDITKECIFCGKLFVTSGRKKLEADYCSRSCASSGSLTELRISSAKLWAKKNNRFLQNIGCTDTSRILKKREAWKYVELEERLQNTPHEFEFFLKDFVYDLLIFDKNLIVEFDAPDHDGKTQRSIDTLKEKIANEEGFKVVRIKVERAEVIPGSVLDSLKDSLETEKEACEQLVEF